MKIDFANLKYQHALYQDEIEQAILKVARNCNFIMGEEVQEFEKHLEHFTNATYAITCSSGTDALLLAIMALDLAPGDEIITTPFTFIATSETMALLRVKPVFSDIDEKTYTLDPLKIEEKITSNTNAIMPVSLYGQPADMDAIQNLADAYRLKVIIDGAQSFGSTCKGRSDSALGDISCTSFFPAKPLGCYGDGGAVFTNDEHLASKLKSLRVHGQTKRYYHAYIGLGGRLDTIQAAILNVKLKYYKKDLVLRQNVAKQYTQALEEIPNVTLPFLSQNTTSAWAQYSIRVHNRDVVQERLKRAEIPTAVHYPVPLHLQECFRYLAYQQSDFPIAERIAQEIISLPMNPYITSEEIAYIAHTLREAVIDH